MNPASVGLVVVSSSEGRALPYGKLEDVVSRDTAALNCHTNDDKYVSLVEPTLNLSSDSSRQGLAPRPPSFIST